MEPCGQNCFGRARSKLCSKSFFEHIWVQRDSFIFFHISLVNSLKKERSGWKKESGGNGIWGTLLLISSISFFCFYWKKPAISQGRRQQFCVSSSPARCHTHALHSQPAAPALWIVWSNFLCGSRVFFLTKNPALACSGCFDHGPSMCFQRCSPSFFWIVHLSKWFEGAPWAPVPCEVLAGYIPHWWGAWCLDWAVFPKARVLYRSYHL